MNFMEKSVYIVKKLQAIKDCKASVIKMIMCSYWLRLVFFSSLRQGRCCFWPLALLQGKAKWLTKYQTVLSCTTLQLPAPLCLLWQIWHRKHDINCRDHLLILGDPRGTETRPLTPHLFHRAVTTPLPPSRKKRKSFNFKFVYIKFPCIKTCLWAVQRSAISLGQYTFFFLGSFHWHFVKFLTGRGLPHPPPARQAERERET